MFQEDELEVKLKRISELQVRLSYLIKEVPLRVEDVDLVAGVDVSYKNGTAFAVAVLCRFPGCEVEVERRISVETPFPYVPTFFFLRETRPILLALRGVDFDVLFVEGHGKAHPRGYGLASHVGLLLNKPTVGIAKALLKGTPPDTYRKVGKAYVSVGHLIDLDSAVELTSLTLENGYPIPLRLADKLSKEEWT